MRPNICVLVLDAARPMNFSCYGHERETTPNVDDVAEESLVFENAVAPSGVTFDSVTSFLSGIYPEEHRSGEVRRVNTDVTLLPEFLRDRGYATFGATSSPSTTPAFGFGRGFDTFDDVTHRSEAGMNVRRFFEDTRDLSAGRRYLAFARRALDRNLPAHLRNAYRFKFGGLDADDDGGRAVTDACIDFVESTDEPWFLYAHYTETHMNSADDLPYKVPAPDARRFVDGPIDPSKLTTRTTEVDYDDETADLHERLYDGAIRYLDGLVGEVVDALRRTGQYEDTLLVVTADHGECVADHGLLGHGFAHEPVLAVPLVVRHPAESPRRVTERVNTLWFYRTVVELLDADLEHPRGVDLFGGDYPESVLVQDFSRNWDWSDYETSDGGLSVLYHGDEKLVDHGHRRELYDLSTDPGEENDLAGQRDLSPLLDRLAELRSGLREPAIGEVGEITEDVEARLSELGYLD